MPDSLTKKKIEEIIKDIPSDVVVVAATKTRSVDEIEDAISAGIKVIGENYFQEAEAKFPALKGRVKLHCIGHLQTNKAKRAAEMFDMIETVDSEKLAKEIDKRCKDIGRIIEVLIEINSGEEKNKQGVIPSDAVGLIKKLSCLKNIRIKGLMTMAPCFADPEESRKYFKLVKELFDRIKEMDIPDVDMEILSMGMSDSYKVAIEEGANMVRLGTILFGKRRVRWT